jgi:hypothetical protein
MKRISFLSHTEVVGSGFQTDEGVIFKVLKGEHYPQSAIARQHQKYCGALPDGVLVSLSFRGKSVPVVKVSDGVVRLRRVILQEGDIEAGQTSSEVSQLLGVSEVRQPIGLYQVL